MLRLPLLILFFLMSCGGSKDDRPEVIASLRTFGISCSPMVSLPSIKNKTPTEVEVTFFAAVPLGETAKLSSFVDSGSSSGALPLPAEAIQVQAGSEKYQDFKNFRLFSAKAKLLVPTIEDFAKIGIKKFTGAQVRYGLTIQAGTAKEDVIANLDVFPSGSKELNWKQPTVSITAPTSGQSISSSTDFNLVAKVGNTNSENLKVGWFVSSGQVSNRRSANTYWKVTTAGSQTVAIVVHGVNSRGFAIQVADTSVK